VAKLVLCVGFVKVDRARSSKLFDIYRNFFELFDSPNCQSVEERHDSLLRILCSKFIVPNSFETFIGIGLAIGASGILLYVYLFDFHVKSII